MYASYRLALYMYPLNLVTHHLCGSRWHFLWWCVQTWIFIPTWIPPWILIETNAKSIQCDVFTSLCFLWTSAVSKLFSNIFYLYMFFISFFKLIAYNYHQSCIVFNKSFNYQSFVYTVRPFCLQADDFVNFQFWQCLGIMNFIIKWCRNCTIGGWKQFWIFF